MKKKNMRARIAELEAKLDSWDRYIDHIEGQNTDLRTILAKVDNEEIEQEMHDLVNEASVASSRGAAAAMAHNEIKEKQGRGRKGAAAAKADRKDTYLSYQDAYFKSARKKANKDLSKRDACGAAREAICKTIKRDTGAAPKRTHSIELFPAYKNWPDSERT